MKLSLMKLDQMIADMEYCLKNPNKQINTLKIKRVGRKLLEIRNDIELDIKVK